MIRELSWGDRSEYFVKIVKSDNTYVLHMFTDAIDFHCAACDTTLSNRCLCDDVDWCNNKLRDSQLLASQSLPGVQKVFDCISNQFEAIRDMNRSELILWIVPFLSSDIEFVCNY